MYLISPLKEKLSTYLPAEQLEKVEQAYLLARDAHEGQTRSSGDPYITHPVAVAHILADMHMDYQTIVAALLHDVIEDTEVSREDIAEKFGETIADLVEGVTKLTQIKFSTKAEAQAENFRKMMMAMVRDIRVILIKLADRLHNMRTLGPLEPKRRRRIAQETLEIYAPIANRLGIYTIRAEYERLGFQAMYPMRYRILEQAVRKARGHRQEIIDDIQMQISQRLKAAGIQATVQARQKSLYSIYQKMKRKRASFQSIMDVYGFRVITDTVDSCYRVLGQIHNLFKPVPDRFKDYIAIPKVNGYQSLHTTLKSPQGLHIEVQIRTEEMHQMAEKGVAAHWLYKTGDNANPAEIRAREWMQNLLEYQDRTDSSLDFIEHVKIDLFPDEVYVFTPDGNIVELPRGATPVDFAYAIHTDVGNSCIACRIDGKLAPLSTPLVNGQTVMIVTAPGARPNPSWLSFVKTAKARANIRHYLRSIRQDEAIQLGKRLLAKALNGQELETLSDDAKEKLLKGSKYKSLDELMMDVGLGVVPAQVLAKKLMLEEREGEENSQTKPLAIKGTEGLILAFAECCHPIPGDPIIGETMPGKGIRIHRESCSKVESLRGDADRLLSVAWEEHVEGEYASVLRVVVFNRRGVLAGLTHLIAAEEGNIIDVSVSRDDGQTNTLTFQIAVRDRVHLARIIKRLRRHPAVLRIGRI
ncbi:MAG: guanosine-3',5'-bis(diphosphate) 3'-diphosphatase [Gammaproteobacteria bacterium]|nr:MAG: guanosine-3',5'-bis(diphosphate) 3'-diphosphatase [Gammaproteobacteria bacterium]